jgi:hypothetical protein
MNNYDHANADLQQAMSLAQQKGDPFLLKELQTALQN